MKSLIGALCFFLVVGMGWAEGNAVSYQVNGEDFEGYFVSPSPDAPLVLLIHDWDGLTEYEVKRAAMLAELGYAVFAADLFGAGVRPAEVAERRRLTSALYADRERMRSLMQGALDAARAQGGQVDNAVAIGYCFGGTAVLELARSGAELKGFAPFHGALETPAGQDFSRTKGKIMVFHGTADSRITMEHFGELATELEEQGIAHEMVCYGGAPHAFTVFGSDRYREEADQNSWSRFTQFLADTLRNGK